MNANVTLNLIVDITGGIGIAFFVVFFYSQIRKIIREGKRK